MEASPRSGIITAFFEKVKLVGTPEGPWRMAEKSPILRVQPQQCPAFYVFDFQEHVVEESRQTNDLVRAKLYVMLEIFASHNLSTNPSDLLNNLLYPIQQELQGDTLDGRCQRVSEVGSKFKIDSAEQRLISAEVAFQIIYVRPKL